MTLRNRNAGALIGPLIGWYEARLRRYRQQVDDKHAKLQRQVDRLDRFAAEVRHDLRNPLNVAAGNVELAQTAGGSDRLETVASSLDRINEIIDDVLTMAREGHADEESERVDLSDIVATSWANVPADSAEIELLDDRSFAADTWRFKLVFENLFRNAVEHAGPAVSVGVGALDGGFYVENDGPGIPPDVREAVFEPGHSTSQRGTGFGLSIVTQLVEAHGWEIAVVDGSDGGSRFEITGVTTTD